MNALDDMIRTLRSMGQDGDFAEAVAARAAPLLDKAVKATASAGQAPDGTPWPATKDGHKPLANAAAHINTSAHGAFVRQTLTGPDVFHHFGATRGGIRRQVIPDAGAEIPEVVADAIERAAAAEFAERTGAR